MQITREHQTIDATDKAPGRLASEIAALLIGKTKVNYMPNMDMGDFVRVTNASKMKITGNKMNQKLYRHHSGYPGGLKEKLMKTLWAENPSKVLEAAVSRMLPKNKLRTDRLKRLTIEN